MKDHVEIGHFTKYDTFRVNRAQAMNLEIWFKIHDTNVSNYETASHSDQSQHDLLCGGVSLSIG